METGRAGTGSPDGAADTILSDRQGHLAQPPAGGGAVGAHRFAPVRTED